jgi:RNA 3'-terminal phosphate cyclase (ATP)
MRRPGFYPKGGGEIFASCGIHHHAPELKALQRGALTDLHILSTYSNIPRDVAERQFHQASAELSKRGFSFDSQMEELPAFSSGSQLMVNTNYEEGSCAYFALGERSVPAEKIGQEAAQKFLDFHAGEGAIDQYLADQLLIPAVLNRHPVAYTTNEVTQHLLTNRAVILKFVPCHIRIGGEPGTVKVERKTK